ncbi:MAG: septum formation initiator family protein [Bacteroidaceae bacterium]|nr:septum formation initiator family protein [Bacteroidaceae bacterium]
MKYSIKVILFKLKYVFAFLLFAVAITFFGESSLINRYAQQQEISKLRGEIEAYQRRFNKDNAMLNSLKTDPEALRQIARERYYMKTPDEDIFVIEDEE